MNALDRSTTLIANKPFRFAGRLYSPADKFDYKRLGHAQRRKVVRMIDGPDRKIAELTPATMEKALRFRDNPRPPRGFTLAGLLGLGMITQEQIERHGWAQEDQNKLTEVQAPWVAPDGSWQVRPEAVEGVEQNTDDMVWVIPFHTAGKPGRAGVVRFFVVDADGENLNGEASINGKAQATEWALTYLAQKAATRAAASGDDQDWSGFPENHDDWSDEQVEVFNHWYEGLPEGEDPGVEHPAIVRLVAERRMTAPQDQAVGKFFGMTDAEARDFVDNLSDDDLTALVAAATGKPAEELGDVARVGLAQMAIDAHTEKAKEAQDGGDLQSGA